MDTASTNGPSRNRLETGLAWFSLGVLIVYIPAETFVSWPDLGSPGYIVDVMAFGLLAYGGAHSLRARPLPGAGPLCGAWGFSACLGWRSYFMRVLSRQHGLGVYADEPACVEPAVGAAMVLAFVAFGLCLYVARVRPLSADVEHVVGDVGDEALEQAVQRGDHPAGHVGLDVVGGAAAELQGEAPGEQERRGDAQGL